MSVLLFVSQVSPVGCHASSVILHRHLAAFEQAGFQIAVAIPEDVAAAAELPPTWRCARLPLRRFYYPPYRAGSGWARTARWMLFDRVLRRALGGRPPAAVIGLLQGDYLVNYAGWISARRRRPLFYFYHDRSELLYHARDSAAAGLVRAQNLRLLRQPFTRRVWTVCPQLVYPEPDLAGKFLTVYPLPEPIPGTLPRWRPEFAAAPVLAYAGSIYNEVLDPLRAIAAGLRAAHGQLRFYSHMREQAEKLAAEFPGTVSYAGERRKTAELCQELRSIAAGFLVAYPDDVSAMPWSVDCFPSKFTQLAQTGLPGLVFAPRATSIGWWCEQAGWSLYRPDSSAPSVAELLAQVRGPASWEQAAEESARAARGDFDPGAIESLVLADLRAHLSPAAPAP